MDGRGPGLMRWPTRVLPRYNGLRQLRFEYPGHGDVANTSSGPRVRRRRWNVSGWCQDDSTSAAESSRHPDTFVTPNRCDVAGSADPVLRHPMEA